MEYSRPSSPMSVDTMIEEDQRLIEAECSKHPDWRWKKNEAFANLQVHGHSCIIARDARTSDNRNVKQFASIQSSCYLVDLVRATPLLDRCLYECLLPGTLQKAHFDLEYYCNTHDAECAWEHLIIVLCRLSRALQAVFSPQLHGDNPLFGITEGTRPTGNDSVKVSYHLCVQNLFFKSPNGILRTFVKRFITTEKQKWQEEVVASRQGGDDRLNKLLRDAPSHGVIDVKVYSSFQQMRMPLSCKCTGGAITVLRGLHDSFDPLLSLMHVQKPDPFDTDDVDKHRNLFLTAINSSNASFIESHTVIDYSEAPLELTPVPCRTRNSRSQLPNLMESEVPEKVEAFIKECMQNCTKQDALETHRVRGIIQSYPSAFTVPLQLVCGAGIVRRCPLQQPKEEMHSSNNQYLSIGRTGIRKGQLHVLCHSQLCKGRRLPIGTLPKGLLEVLEKTDVVKQKGEGRSQNISEDNVNHEIQGGHLGTRGEEVEDQVAEGIINSNILCQSGMNDTDIQGCNDNHIKGLGSSIDNSYGYTSGVGEGLGTKDDSIGDDAKGLRDCSDTRMVTHNPIDGVGECAVKDDLEDDNNIGNINCTYGKGQDYIEDCDNMMGDMDDEGEDETDSDADSGMDGGESENEVDATSTDTGGDHDDNKNGGSDDAPNQSSSSRGGFYERIKASSVVGSVANHELLDYNFEADELYNSPRCAFPCPFPNPAQSVIALLK